MSGCDQMRKVFFHLFFLLPQTVLGLCQTEHVVDWSFDEIYCRWLNDVLSLIWSKVWKIAWDLGNRLQKIMDLFVESKVSKKHIEKDNGVQKINTKNCVVKGSLWSISLKKLGGFTRRTYNWKMQWWKCKLVLRTSLKPSICKSKTPKCSNQFNIILNLYINCLVIERRRDLTLLIFLTYFKT